MDYLKEQDENFLCAFHADSMHLYMYYQGGPLVAYEFLIGDHTLFKRNDYRPSPLHNVDSIESVVNLLGFLTVQPGGVEEDYFHDYTQEQMDWAESMDCEKLGGMVTDFEAGEPEYKKAAQAYFKKGFTREAKVN